MVIKNLKFLQILGLVLCFHQSTFAAWTSIINPSEKVDAASEKLMSQTKDVNVQELIKLSELLVSPQEFEGLIKDTKKAKNLKIDSIMHGEDFFYMQAGPIKVVFKWIDKDNIAYKINGHSFTYEEAAKTELWQKKIHQIVKNYQNPRNALSQPKSDKVSFNFHKQESSFVVKLGRSFTSMLVLPLLFQATPAQAFLPEINWQSPWVWTGIAAVTIALVANHYYRKHKKEHAANRSRITERLSNARGNLAAAQERGEQNLSAYQKEVTDLENLLTEYGSSSNDVGFFGFLFGNRMSRPASYDVIMSRPTNGGSGGGGAGTPTPPPTNGGGNGVF